jgi:hypothetical protein
VVTTKERLKAKKTHVLLSLLVICVFLTIVVQLLCRGCKEEDSPLEIFEDEYLKCRVASFQEPGVFDNFSLGWNNETFWFKNKGDQRIEIGLCVRLLPKGWAMIWDYDRLLIEPDSAVKVVISVFSSYLMPADSLMLGVDFKYRVLDQE